MSLLDHLTTEEGAESHDIEKRYKRLLNYQYLEIASNDYNPNQAQDETKVIKYRIDLRFYGSGIIQRERVNSTQVNAVAASTGTIPVSSLVGIRSISALVYF